MWPFVNDVSRFPGIVIENEIVSEHYADLFSNHFSNIIYNIGSLKFRGKVCSSKRFNLMRALVSHRATRAHVLLCVRNSASFPALKDYKARDPRWDRFLLRDAILVFVHALAETFATFQSRSIITMLTEEILNDGQSALFFKVFNEFFEITDQTALLEELSFSLLYYTVMLQTTNRHWKKLFTSSQRINPIMAELILKKVNAPDSKLEIDIEVLFSKDIPCASMIYDCYHDDPDDLIKIQFLMYIIDPDSPRAFDLHSSLRSADKREHSDRVVEWIRQKCLRNRQVHRRMYREIMKEEQQWESEYDSSEHEETDGEKWQKIAEKITNQDFKEALNLLEAITTSQASTIDESDERHYSAVRGYIASKCDDREVMKTARQLLIKAASKYPLAKLWLAELYVRTNDYSAAKEQIESAAFGRLSIPNTTIFLEPSSFGDFVSRLMSVKLSIDHPNKPDYVCCGSCDEKNIYKQNLDFNGCVQMLCAQGCILTTHVECWKILANNSGHKHGLGATCYTPDCPGRITMIITFSSTMELKKEYRWKGASSKTASIHTAQEKIDDNVLEALRSTVSRFRDQFSRQELIGFCCDFLNSNRAFAESFVGKCFENEERNEHTKGQWLKAIDDSLQNQQLDLSELNSQLSSIVITEKLTPEEIAVIEEECKTLLKEFDKLLSEEVALKNQLFTTEKQNDISEINDLQAEIKNIEDQLIMAEHAKREVQTAEQRLTQKQALVADLDKSISEAKCQTKDELLPNLSIAQMHYDEATRERAELSRTLNANAQDARTRLRLAAMELNETRYTIDMDILQSVQRAVVKNLAAVERQRSPEMRQTNSETKKLHFLMMNKIANEIKAAESQTKATTEQIKNGCMDHEGMPSLHQHQLRAILTEYARLPPLYLTAERPTLQFVATKLL